MAYSTSSFAQNAYARLASVTRWWDFNKTTRIISLVIASFAAGATCMGVKYAHDDTNAKEALHLHSPLPQPDQRGELAPRVVPHHLLAGSIRKRRSRAISAPLTEEQIADIQRRRAAHAFQRLGDTMLLNTALISPDGTNPVIDAWDRILLRYSTVQVTIAVTEYCELQKTFLQKISPFYDGAGECSVERRAFLSNEGQSIASEIKAYMLSRGLENTIAIEQTQVIPIAKADETTQSEPSARIQVSNDPSPLEATVMERAAPKENVNAPPPWDTGNGE